jgi:hypothetical protein
MMERMIRMETRGWRGGGRRRGTFEGRRRGWARNGALSERKGGEKTLRGRLIGHDDDDDDDADANNNLSTHTAVVKREGGERRSPRRMWGVGGRDVALEGRRGEGWTAMRKGAAAQVVDGGEKPVRKSMKTD